MDICNHYTCVTWICSLPTSCVVFFAVAIPVAMYSHLQRTFWGLSRYAYPGDSNTTTANGGSVIDRLW